MAVKNPLYSRTDDEQCPSDFSVLFVSLFTLFSLFNPFKVYFLTLCIPSLLFSFSLPALLNYDVW